MDQGNFQDLDALGGNPPPFGMDPGGPGSGGGPLPDQHDNQYLGRVNMWQQRGGYALPESGFHSADNTHPSSMTGHEDGMEDSASFHGGQGSIANSLYDLDSAAHSEVSSIVSASHPMMNNDPNEVIHGLASTLGDDEHGIVKESLLTLEKMLKNRQTAQRFHPIVAGSNPLIHALVGATLRAFQVLAPESGETQQALEEAVERAQKSATILRILAEPQKDVPNREKQQNQIHACSGIVHNHGASVLTMLLPYENPRIRNNCVVTIHTLLEALKHDKQQYEMAKEQIRKAKGPEVMMGQLKNSSNEKLSAILCDCLYHLAKMDRPTKNVIRENDGIACMLHILEHQQYYNLIEKTMNLLQILSTDLACKKLINQNNGTDAIAKKILHFLSSGNTTRTQEYREHYKILYYAASAMGNISDGVEALKDENMVILAHLEALRNPTREWAEKIINSVLGSLYNLLVKIPNLKLKMVQTDGMAVLFDILNKCVCGNQEARNLVEPVLCAIKPLTGIRFPANSPNSSAERHLQMEFMKHTNELNGMKKFLDHKEVPPQILKEALAIIRNIAPNFPQLLRREHFLQQILILFRIHHEEMKQNGPLNPKSKYVKILDIVEPCVICVLSFIRDPESKRALFGPQSSPADKPLEEMFGVIDMLTDLLLILNAQLRHDPSLSRKQILLVMKITTQVLCLIAQEREGAFLIDERIKSKKPKQGEQPHPLKQHPLTTMIEAFDPPKDEAEKKINTFSKETINLIGRMNQDQMNGIFRPSEHLRRLANVHRNILQGPPLPPQGAFPHNSMNNGPPNQFHGHPGPMGPGDFPPHGFQPNMQPGPGFDDMMSPMGSGPPPPMPPQGFDPMGGPPPPHMVQGPGGQFEGMFDDFGGNQDFYNMQ